MLTALVAALGDAKRRSAVMEILEKHLEKVPACADFAPVRGDLPRLRAILDPAIPALRQAMSLEDEGARYGVGGLLGRIVSFSRSTRDPEFLKSLEPTLQAFLLGLDSANLDVRFQVLDEVGTVPIGRASIVSALVKFLERPESTAEEQQAAAEAVGAQARSADSDVALREALKPAVPVLVKALSSPATEVRVAAAKALGQIGVEAKAAEDALRSLAKNDPQAEVRKGAEDALKAITGIMKKETARAGGRG